ncbi:MULTISPECIES: MbtH family protein [unclassified Bradyrhizobium]|uniref:MbtH family protein n=1 Tax=Bradyrhizobium TaxID=374 RepID=UPI0028E545D2|nr:MULTISPECIES: MbtH family NRPS accessory protein [unclassified Bradyrhizobium]
MMVFDREDVTFTVVVNHEEQYSIWPTFKDIPNGWTAVGVTGSKKECLDHIEQVWTDMRPLSLRKFMQENAQASAES